MGALTLTQVTKSFGKTDVIKGVDLQVEEGEFCVFVGPSGCGKSTLLRMIAGLEDVSSGEVALDGARINDLAPGAPGNRHGFSKLCALSAPDRAGQYGAGPETGRHPQTRDRAGH